MLSIPRSVSVAIPFMIIPLSQFFSYKFHCNSFNINSIVSVRSNSFHVDSIVGIHSNSFHVYSIVAIPFMLIPLSASVAIPFMLIPLLVYVAIPFMLIPLLAFHHCSRHRFFKLKPGQSLFFAFWNLSWPSMFKLVGLNMKSLETWVGVPLCCHCYSCHCYQ